jgi:hypothetical protein
MRAFLVCSIALLLIGLTFAQANSQSPGAKQVTLIKAGRLLDVRAGHYLIDQGVLIEGGPLKDIEEMGRVKFVMKGGKVWKDALH